MENMTPQLRRRTGTSEVRKREFENWMIENKFDMGTIDAYLSGIRSFCRRTDRKEGDYYRIFTHGDIDEFLSELDAKNIGDSLRGNMRNAFINYQLFMAGEERRELNRQIEFTVEHNVPLPTWLIWSSSQTALFDSAPAILSTLIELDQYKNFFYQAVAGRSEYLPEIPHSLMHMKNIEDLQVAILKTMKDMSYFLEYGLENAIKERKMDVDKVRREAGYFHAWLSWDHVLMLELLHENGLLN